MEGLIQEFLSTNANDYDYGYGKGYGNGYLFGYGEGRGDGYSNGVGDGDGYSYDYSCGYGNGDGNGDGKGDGDGSGYGNGNGYGDGDGAGSVYGNGNGYGNGSGYVDGYGNGYGNGNGIIYYNGHKVHIIDNTPTIITQVRGNLARGYALSYNVYLIPCYIAKVGGHFAHGDTARQAYLDAQKKYQENKPLEDRIADFIAQYPNLDSIATHQDLFKWHNVLTGSCDFGRREFCKSKNLDPTKGEMSIRDFINLTINSYGGDNINQLKQSYKQ